MNWPIAGSLVKIIGKHGKIAEPYMLEILKGKDEAWKYNILSSLLYEWPSYPEDALMKEIIRIADHPTPEESLASTPPITHTARRPSHAGRVTGGSRSGSE